MRRKLALMFRRWAERLDPSPVDRLMPLAREAVAAGEDQQVAGSIKWLVAMKTLERATGAPRRYINAAIDRAVLELHP